MLGRRTDGYHEIESVFQAIDLCDRLTLHARPPEDGITCAPLAAGGWANAPGGDAADLPSDHRNLCHRAARALIERTGERLGVHIEIAKQIPVRAGLGGGSSDAAGTLVGLNELYGLGLDDGALGEVAAAVGSDVPFFLTGGTALVRGRGERVTPLSVEHNADFVLVLPAVPYMSTADAYARLAAQPLAAPLAEPTAETGRMLAALERGDLDAIAAALHNDFEPLALAAYPRIAQARGRLLAAGSRGALLAGSGAAVFGLAAGRERAEAIAAETARTRRAHGDSAVAAAGASGGSAVAASGRRAGVGVAAAAVPVRGEPR